MTLKNRTLQLFKKLNMPVSYRVLDQNHLMDGRNIFNGKDVTETRHGIKGYNATSLGASILSASFFKDTSSNRYKLAKVGTVIYKVNPTGANTSIKTGLSATTKHRGVTLNNRHIIAVGSDGLFSYNGTLFTQLGQAPPTTGTATIAAGGSLTDVKNYKAGLTFYSSATGFESNVYESNQVTTASPNQQIDMTLIPATAANTTIDKVRVYLKNVSDASAYLFIREIDLGTTTTSITAVATSTQIPPTTNAPPLSGGGKYLTTFGKKLVYAGNSSFPNDVFFSEEYLPDAYDDTSTATILNIDGQGPITGIATGFYNQDNLSPYLVIFKKTSTTIYSELGGSPVQVVLDSFVGCVSHDTIKTRNGIIYFMSENGWYAIKDGAFIKDQKGMPRSLGDGAIDDAFSRAGWTNELNSTQYENFFSVYYPTLKHYITFIAEGANNRFSKAYQFEEDINGFRVMTFRVPLSCACEGEDDTGAQCVFIGDTSGKLYTYSVKNERHDENELGTEQSIPVQIILPAIDPDDDSVTCNWKSMILKAFVSDTPIQVYAYPTYSFQTSYSGEFDFPDSGIGFTLDVSILDEDILGDERSPSSDAVELNITGEVLVLAITQDVADSNIALISAQIDYNKNRNRNK